MFEQRAALRKKESFALTHSKKLTMSSEYLTEEEHERLRKVLENKPLPLWRLFREALLNGGACRDIVEKHVMCKLNGTDLKFFYEVNTETRKLIKRSSRAEDLEEKFKIEEMSSISTLEFVWENKSLWSGYLEDEIDFCEEVARTNKLELLKWAREEKECEWVCHRNISGNRGGHKESRSTNDKNEDEKTSASSSRSFQSEYGWNRRHFWSVYSHVKLPLTECEIFLRFLPENTDAFRTKKTHKKKRF